MRRIVPNGHCFHLIIDNQSPEAVALVEAILDADQAVRREGVAAADIDAAYKAIASAEVSWCRAHNFKYDIVMQRAIHRLADNLHRTEARHASA